jgi:hypothetical protein
MCNNLWTQKNYVCFPKTKMGFQRAYPFDENPNDHGDTCGSGSKRTPFTGYRVIADTLRLLILHMDSRATDACGGRERIAGVVLNAREKPMASVTCASAYYSANN